ncbi:MAG TPA: NAD-binding protein [Chloroflexia bacterium]|jgi:voltage-gated potassium channel Kch
MRKITFGQKLRYGFDNTMSKGTPALLAWLGALSLLLVLVVSLVVATIAPPDENLGFHEILWKSLLRTLDPGTMGGDTGQVPFLFAMLGITLGGIFIVSTLIGVLTSGIEGKLDELRKGRSFVVESGHTLVLGWSDQVFTIISELVQANANQKKPCIVVLADKDKVEMEEEIRSKVGSTGRTRVVCRTGSPIDLSDLEIVNPQGSRSIIVLAAQGDDADAQAIKTILAITNNPRRRPEPYHIVAQIRQPENMEAARMVGGKEAQIIEVDDTISRLIAQTCRQSGLSEVYTELLDFGGDEIYFQEEPQLVGKTFGQALMAYEKSAVIGLQGSDESVAMNPPMDTLIKPGDKIIAISEDDDTVKLSGLTDYKIDEEAIVESAMSVGVAERILILGWNHRAPAIIRELDNYVVPGSVLTVVANDPAVEQVSMGQAAELNNFAIEFQLGDPTSRKVLNALHVENYQHVIVLSDLDAGDPQRADTRTLMVLLQLRDIEAQLGDKFSIVSEMLDDRNRELADVTRADDFIVSDKLVSLMMSQISENKYLGDLFTDILNTEGSEIYLKPAKDYVLLGRPVNFYTVVEAARRRGHVAIGYKQQPQSGEESGIVVNPEKSKVLTFSEADRIVVLAEE